MAKVLVEMDITKGLIPKLDIVCGDNVFTQRLDYLHMSFRCNYCHDTGHLQNTCHRLRSGHPSKRGFNCFPVSDPLPSENFPLPAAPLEDSTDIIYASSSPSTFDDLLKGQLMYIEYM